MLRQHVTWECWAEGVNFFPANELWHTGRKLSGTARQTFSGEDGDLSCPLSCPGYTLGFPQVEVGICNWTNLIMEI